MPADFSPHGGHDYDRQVQRPGPVSNVDTEASALHGPGTLFAPARNGGAANWPIYTRGPIQAMMATNLLDNHTLSEVGPGSYEAAPKPPPALIARETNLSPPVFEAMCARVHALTQAFRATAGRWPQWPIDDTYFTARDQIVNELFGPPGNAVNGG